jgi:hypothetical protein
MSRVELPRFHVGPKTVISEGPEPEPDTLYLSLLVASCELSVFEAFV